jgi:hypothetical protein
VGVVVCCAVATGCGPSSVTLPVPPADLQAVAAEYDNPPGTVPPSAMQQITELQQTLNTIAQTHLADLVSDTLISLRERLAMNGVATDPATGPKDANRFTLRGSVVVDRVCGGWDDTSTTPAPSTNGSIELTAVVDGSRLQRNVWGTASACRGRVDVANAATVHAFLDGTLAIFLGGPLPTSVTDADFIVAWSGMLGTEQAQAMVSFDFRIVYPQIEVRIPAADGNIIGSIGADGVSLRGNNGTFGCSSDTFTCAAGQTARGTAP